LQEYSLKRLIQRLWWDFIDPDERKYQLYFFLVQIPGIFGDMLRGRFVSNRVRRCGKNLRVQAGARFRSMEKLSLGNHVVIGSDNFIQAYGGVTLGDYTITAPSVKIWSVDHNFSDPDKPVHEQELTKAEVVIGKDVWIASNSFIMPGVTLPDGVVVTVGSIVCVGAYKPYSILSGNPAKVIGYRGGKSPK
jgi:acetyltransferase-like isoleucine patch superfamily enzyme